MKKAKITQSVFETTIEKAAPKDPRSGNPILHQEVQEEMRTIMLDCKQYLLTFCHEYIELPIQNMKQSNSANVTIVGIERNAEGVEGIFACIHSQ